MSPVGRGSTPVSPRYFKSASAFRQWLAKHHARANELLVGFWKKHTGRRSITYAEALDEALAVGWIDGIRRRIDDERYSIRFTRRRPRSRWSQINIAHVEKLAAQGRMQPSGLTVFAARVKTAQRYSHEARPRQFPLNRRRRFQEHGRAWAFFAAQPPGYQRTCIWWVVSARTAATQEKRLEKLIQCSAREERLPEYGRPVPRPAHPRVH
jgi:uncharacterized protein YdeI (YjbR/CyaY-like superfamily)